MGEGAHTRSAQALTDDEALQLEPLYARVFAPGTTGRCSPAARCRHLLAARLSVPLPEGSEIDPVDLERVGHHISSPYFNVPHIVPF